MLCTRMQLTERRFRIKSSLSYQNSDGEYESSATVSCEGRAPFVRPCAIIKMFNGDNADGNESIISSGRAVSAVKAKADANRKTNNEPDSVNITDVNGSPTNLDRSDEDISENKMNDSHQSSYRAPLIVVTLYLPSEAKTLAPLAVKRDLRRPPSFCQKFQRNSSSKQCKCKINAKPDLMLRGKEITETSSNLCTTNLPPNQDNDDILRNDDKMNDECMACSACIMDMERRTPLLTPVPCLDEAALEMGFDKYHMDSFGNLTKNFEIPCTEDVDGEKNDSLDCSMPVISRPGSADTSRIIRITLNNKSSIDGSSKQSSSNENQNTVPRDIKTATF
ncbi:uncharacterized protein LOC116350878 [Contarinia nasturtii]|uniref:uncharacterized protein LOC116350878 n=1 Tax=Contarinia nasturtii TaxID=265458 RepID=UPI0012D38C68|nr:uncharacterized protein LOC116350878 [Contarinia nasturtii]XP_031638711.1 uncharacterized protein LOC116350878 [Contarinia nasturtii]XP_031638712.1 uncharacterized protein LOC116350878 [Contarinia nasturtii]